MKLLFTKALTSLSLMGLISFWQGNVFIAAETTGKNSLGCLDPASVDYNHDYFPEKAVLKYSKQWSITYHNTYKILYNKPKKVSYLLHQCGTTPPASEAGLHNMTISVPLQNGVAVTSTTQIPPLEHINVRRQIKAFFETYPNAKNSVSSPCLGYLMDENITDVVKKADIETYISANPGLVVFGGPFDDAAHPNYMIISESSELHSKDVYEWQKFFGALFNLEGEATKIVDESVERFDCATDEATAAVAKGVTNRTVVWANYYNGWSVATCDPKFNYYCTFAEHCQANLLHSNEGSIEQYGTKYMNDTEFLDFAKDADHFLYVSGNWDSIYASKKSILDQLKSVNSKEVYDFMGSGPNAWFEQRISEYDVVLQDFCAVVGTVLDESPHTRQWFRNVFKEPVGSLGTCSDADVDLPWKTRASTCAALQTSAPTSAPTESGVFIATQSSQIILFIALWSTLYM